MALLSTLAEFYRHVTGSTCWTWLTQPQKTFPCCWYLLFSSFSFRLKYIPYSDGIRLVLPGLDKETEIERANSEWNSYLSDNKARIVKPTDPDVERVLRVLVKIIQALSDGLRLKRDCKVYANHNVPPFLNNNNNNVVVVPSRCGNKETISRGRFEDSPMSFLGMKYNTEHLDGLDWEVMMVQSCEENAFYHGNGKIVIYDRKVFSSTSEEEIARILAHEVGHGVGMHVEGSPHKALCFIRLIPWPLGFWGPAIFIRLCELVLCCLRRNEYEADHIGLMLMASAGYDPRLVPQIIKELKYDSLLDTTHPSREKRAEMLSRDAVMGRAVKIYEQVQAGHGVPSFV